MSSDTKGYNGWANYETWCVHLWLSNDEGSYRHWREEAERRRNEALSHANVRQGIWTAEQAARFTLAEAMKESFETFHPFRGDHLAKPMEPDVFCDLLDAALSEVRWSEIAEAFLEGIEPEEGPAPEHFLFELGQVVSTPGVLEAVTREEMAEALARHRRGDWGDVGPDDWRENELSLREGFRLLSAYHSRAGETFWVITEADRSVTTILLPSEY